MNYVRIMGVERLSSKSDCGCGVCIAVLDSGFPAYYGIKGPDTDKFGHATAISSILFGGKGITGLCEYADPLYIKVLDDSGRGSVKSVAKGIHEAVAAGADVINLSLGFLRTDSCPKLLEKACKEACEAAKIIICAAGNDGGAVNWPAALKTTICVGSAAENGLKSVFSSVGEVDFVAPGQNLTVLGLDGCKKAVSGTSFSTALVTGVVALLIPSLRKKYSCVGIEQVRDALRGLARDVDAPGYDENTGFGLIFGKSCDPTVNLSPESPKLGFFGTIIQRLRGLIKRS